MKKVALIIALVVVAQINAIAQKSPVFIKNKVAIDGYDPVAFLQKGNQ